MLQPSACVVAQLLLTSIDSPPSGRAGLPFMVWPPSIPLMSRTWAARCLQWEKYPDIPAFDHLTLDLPV